MKSLGSKLILAGGAVAAASCTSPQPAPQRPNIVFILADDLGWGDVGCYGQQRFQTPNIDALADSGLRFTQCYSGTTVSAPSRSCLITGTHSGHTPIRGNLELPQGNVIKLSSFCHPERQRRILSRAQRFFASLRMTLT